MTRNASQLLPDGMAGTAAVVGGYAFVRFHEADGVKRLRWLFACAAACLWCYAIKESTALVFPGFGLAVLLSRRSLKEAALFTGVIALYGVLETAGFRLFTPYAHRMAIVQEEHGFYPPVTFFQLLDRFAKLDPPWQMLFWLWTASVLFDIGSPDKRRRLWVLLPAGYVFFLTFLVRSIDPILQWMSFKPRYMAPAGGFFVAAVAVFAADCARRAWRLLEWSKLREFSAFAARNAGLLTLGLCVVLGAFTYNRERSSLDRHPLVSLRHDASILNDAFRRNLPIVQAQTNNPRGLNTIYAVYLQPKYLAQSTLAKPGWLPDIKEGVQFSKRGEKYVYILRDGSAYHGGEMEELVKAGCGIVVKAKNRVTLDASAKLPEHCKAPRGATIPR
jgi:hypothetical protein